MLNEVKHLANVSCQVPARDSSDATLCQNDTQRGGGKNLWTTAILSPILMFVRVVEHNLAILIEYL